MISLVDSSTFGIKHQKFYTLGEIKTFTFLLNVSRLIIDYWLLDIDRTHAVDTPFSFRNGISLKFDRCSHLPPRMIQIRNQDHTQPITQTIDQRKFHFFEGPIGHQFPLPVGCLLAHVEHLSQAFSCWESWDNCLRC